MSGLETEVRDHAKQLAEMGGALDHIMNTIDTVIIPTQKLHAEEMERHAKKMEAHETFIARMDGAWLLIQRGGIVIAGIGGLISIVTFAIKHLHIG